jgi:3-phenylpropionate/cinnamic acid dioxygenase small subunit
MSNIKMSEWFDLPTTPAKFWLAPIKHDNSNRRDGQRIALVLALNSHDTLIAEVAKLKAVITEISDVLKVQECQYPNEHNVAIAIEHEAAVEKAYLITLKALGVNHV